MYLRDLIFSNTALKNLYVKYRSSVTKDLMNADELEVYLEQADKVLLDQVPDIKVGLVKPEDNYTQLGLVRKRTYHPKYERFLKNNNIAYESYNPLLSSWMEEAKKFDLIVWHTSSDPSTQAIAESKIYILEKMGIRCMPSYKEVWSYEDKIRASYLYKLYDLPSIPTFISHSKAEALSYLESVQYPIISKISTGSSSKGVEKIESLKQGKAFVDKAFSLKGKETYFEYASQKDYVYFQEFIEDATYDLRVICVDNELFGYYRYPNKGDFRASGAGNFQKKAIPSEALELAYQVREIFDSNILATDFVYSEKLNKFLIIETSIFVGVDSTEQLAINGVSGKYIRRAENQYEFFPGKFWIQELALKNKIERSF